MISAGPPTAADRRRWRKMLANERAEAELYRELAARRSGEDHDILLALSHAEARHEQHWQDLLGDDARPGRRSLRSVALGMMARRFGSVFVLALVQNAEAHSPYQEDADATDQMAADERIHAEVIRALAARGRVRLSGTFRAAIFGMNDGLVSNLALVLGIGAAGATNHTFLLTGLPGLLAGALSMAAGEYVSVRSQRELLDASMSDSRSDGVLPFLDLDANEVALVFRARGMTPEQAVLAATDVLAASRSGAPAPVGLPATQPLDIDASLPAAAGSTSVDPEMDEHAAVGKAWNAALSSFLFFASGAVIPVLPYLCGMSGMPAVIVSAAAVGVVLLCTGGAVGVLSGTSPLRRALRQLVIGYGAAAATYVLGLLLGGMPT